MMTVQSLWDSISKGAERASLSDRQRTYLIDLAKAERKFDPNDTTILLDGGKRLRIRNCTTKVGAYGGGLANKTVPGKFYGEIQYKIKFVDSGIEAVYDRINLNIIDREGKHKYEILMV